MLKTYFKIAWRNLKKNRLYTIINVVGLFAGISFALLIAVFVWQELQGNKTLKNANAQYILTSNWKDPNMGVDFATIGPLAERLKEEYPHLVKDFYRWDGITCIIKKGTENFREGIQLGDESLLSMYGFRLSQGNAKTAFNNPNSAVIKEEKALKFFGKTDVVGETLSIKNFEGNYQEFTVTGVLEKMPENSVAPIINKQSNGVFIAKNSADFFNRANFQDWNLPIFCCYVQLQPNLSTQDLQIPIKSLIEKHTSETIQTNLEVVPVKLTDYYLNRNDGGLKQMLYTLSFVGVFIILMAIINFINIAIGHSGSRTKEIGVRKVLGGQQKQLIFQFLSESVVLVGIATVLSCMAYPVFSGWFSSLVGKQLLSLSELPLYFLFIPFLFILVIGLLSGFYPAFVLSSFKSIDALQGRFKIGVKGQFLRKSLLCFQYVTALVVLIVAILVTQQVNNFFGKGLGYDKEFVLTTPVPRDWSLEGVQKMLTYRDELSKLPSVENVSLSYEIPNGNNGFQLAVNRIGENHQDFFASQGLVGDEAYFETYGIPIIAGDFLASGEQNPNYVLINEKALSTYGFVNAKDAIGQNLKVAGEEEMLTIKGVTADFYFESMQSVIKPQLFFSVSALHNYRYLSFKLIPGNINESITEIQEKWQALIPNAPFDYEFIDETLASLYERELQLKNATYTASILSLVVALLGIFGMVSLTISRRLKEIGVRKVLGASLPHISFLFIKDFLIVFGISICIACPVAYFLTSQWLANYSHKITIGFGPFLVGILLIGGVTILLAILQTLKTAITNPSDFLRTE